jgi:regulator of replication initiation timing
MARTISRDALEQKISKLETAISKNRQQYDQLTKELKELLEKKKALRLYFRQHQKSLRDFL